MHKKFNHCTLVVSKKNSVNCQNQNPTGVEHKPNP